MSTVKKLEAQYAIPILKKYSLPFIDMILLSKKEELQKVIKKIKYPAVLSLHQTEASTSDTNKKRDVADSFPLSSAQDALPAFESLKGVIKKKYPQVRFIPIEKNYGFASTVNIGFRASSGRWLGTINDDVILNDNWLKNLLTGTDESLGSINPIIKKTNGDIESMGIKILSKGKAEPITKMAIGKYSQVNATNAAAVIYSKESLNKVGIYDENFGSYLEDVDLSLRISRLGYKNLVSLKSEVIHIGQSTSKDLNWKKQYLDFKNWILVICKNWSLKELIVNLPAIIIERLRNLSGILKSFFSN